MVISLASTAVGEEEGTKPVKVLLLMSAVRNLRNYGHIGVVNYIEGK